MATTRKAPAKKAVTKKTPAKKIAKKAPAKAVVTTKADPPSVTEEQLQKQVAEAVAKAVAEAKAAQVQGLVTAQSKPDLVDHLRETWRKSGEHKAAQVKLFLYTFFGLFGSQVIGDYLAGKPLFENVHDVRSLMTFVLPFALVAWRQKHPVMTAEQADKADGVTIVPSQVGAPTVDVPVEPAQVEVPLPDDTLPEVADAVADVVDMPPGGDAAP